MASERAIVPLDGGDVSLQDLNKSFTEAAHADDYVFAEIFKLPPYNGSTYAKAIAPFQSKGTNTALVQPGSTASLPLVVMPFRAVVGSRVLANSTPVLPPPVSVGDPIITTGQEANIRDIRSAYFAPIQPNNAIGYAIPASAFPTTTTSYWALIYATVYIDQSGGNVTILVKPSTGGTAVQVSTPESYTTTVGLPSSATSGSNPGVTVLNGTASATSISIPSLPADSPSTGVFNIPLAAVLVGDGGGWTSGTSVFFGHDILMLAPIATIAEGIGAASSQPATINSGGGSFTSSIATTWGTAISGAYIRPSTVLPTTMVGGVKRHLFVDATSAAGSAPVGNGGVLDVSVDWRKRLFKTTCFCYQSSGAKFVSDETGGTAPVIPNASAFSGIGVSVPVPFSVFGSNIGPIWQTGYTGGAFFTDTVGSSTYYIPLSPPNGSTLTAVGGRYQTGGTPPTSAGNGGLYVFKTNLSTGAVTQLGTRAQIPTSGLSANTMYSLSVGSLTEVVNTTLYSYQAMYSASLGSGAQAVNWFPVTMTLTNGVPSSVNTCGQSMYEDSAWLTGTELGTGNGAGMVFYATTAQLPQLAASSSIGVYVDIATGNLCLEYSGTPAVKLAFFIEATGTYDNL